MLAFIQQGSSAALSLAFISYSAREHQNSRFPERHRTTYGRNSPKADAVALQRARQCTVPSLKGDTLSAADPALAMPTAASAMSAVLGVTMGRFWSPGRILVAGRRFQRAA